MEFFARGTLAILSLGAVSWNSSAGPAHPDRRLTSIRSQRSNHHSRHDSLGQVDVPPAIAARRLTQ
jgi:hypothetical protein